MSREEYFGKDGGLQSSQVQDICALGFLGEALSELQHPALLTAHSAFDRPEGSCYPENVDTCILI